jgi:biotin synthase
MLVRVEGTPLAKAPEVNPFDLVRLIALSRVVMPRAMVRLSAGRTQMSAELQALCFMAGANSVFSGDKLLTTPNVGDDYDNKLLQELGMHFAPVNPKEEEAAQVCNA